MVGCLLKKKKIREATKRRCVMKILLAEEKSGKRYRDVTALAKSTELPHIIFHFFSG
jgi:hypothetical protein